MSFLEGIHGQFVFPRRVRVLTGHLLPLIPEGSRVLDVGSGEGQIARAIASQRPDVEIRGIDVLVRRETHVPVEAFDGENIPFDDASFDVLLFVDVLHHATDPLRLLREALRITRQAIVIKDHRADGFLAVPTLRFMDRLGNARHGVSLPYNYWPQKRWREAFDLLGLRLDVWIEDLGLYPRPASWLFERDLHFLARLRPGG